MTQCVILHEYGAPEHYRGLQSLLAEAGENEPKFVEFGFIKLFIKGLLRGDSSRIRSAIRSAIWIILASFGVFRGQKIVLGVAPYDTRIVALLPIIFFNRIYWHNSWPYWGTGREPKNSSSLVRWIWKNIFFKRIEHAFFVTEHAASNFRSVFGENFAISTVGHAFDVKVFHPCSVRTLLKDSIRVGYAGRLEKVKGIDSFIEVAHSLSCEWASFAVAGDGPMEMVVTKAAAQFPPRKFTHHGFLPHKALGKFFRDLDVLLLPSKTTPHWEEVFGMVIIEAMACGVVPLTTAHPGPVEILGASHPEWLFDESNFCADVVKSIVHYHNDRSLLERDRTAAIRMASGYSQERVRQRWTAFLD